MGKIYQLKLTAIEENLRQVQLNFEDINDTLSMRREHIADVIIENMMSGYAYLNELLAKRVDILKENHKHHALELNYRVLCGTDNKVRFEFGEHLQMTNKRFYSQKECNINKIMKWYKDHKSDSAWRRAAGIYIYLISNPQLFFEGNHRTGALIMSAILTHEGYPPFVLTSENARAYFDPSALAKLTQKDFLGRYYKLPSIAKNFSRFLKEQTDDRFLETIKS